MSRSELVRLSAEHLRVYYGSTIALSCPRFSVTGRVIAIIGHNGSGKSTMLKTLLGLVPNKSGTIEASRISAGQVDLLAPEKDMAFSPERGAIFEDLSVESYIKLWCRIKHFDARYYLKEGSRFIERFSVAELLPKLGRQLSKGERQRVQAAIGFLTRPKLFLFDEPFDGLDLRQSSELASALLEESAQTSIILSSHRMEVIERLADQVVVLQKGEPITHGSVEDVCRFLCHQSAMLSLTPPGLEADLLLDLLKAKYLSCLINRIGSNVWITGHEVDYDELAGYLAERKIDGVHVEKVKPTLTDAMNYHLRRLN